MMKIEGSEGFDTRDPVPRRRRPGRARSRARWAVWCLGPLVWPIVACGGEREAGQPATSAVEAAQRTAGRVADRAEQMAQQAAQVAEIDMELAARGEEAFRGRGCVACHTVGGGRLVGPDLMGVTARRTPGWIRAMIQNPDSMLKNDATAKQLYAEYFTPMPNQQVTGEQAAAIYEFLRSKDAGG